MATDFSYLGSGKVYMRVAGSSAGLIEVGNCSALNFAVQEETKELTDHTQAGGGTWNQVRRITGVEASMTMHDMSAANLAIAVFGNASAIAAGTVTNESAGAAYKNALVPTAYPVDLTQTFTAKHAQFAAAARANSTPYALGAYILPAAPNGFVYKATAGGTSGGSIPTYPTTIGGTVVDGTVTWTCVGVTAALTATTDYTAVSAGALMAAAPANIYDGEPIVISYTKLAGNAVEALLNSAQEYEIYFAGVNEARSGKAVNVRAYRVKFGPLQNLPLIGDDYAGLELTGRVLADTTKNGTSVSRYFNAQIVT